MVSAENDRGMSVFPCSAPAKLSGASFENNARFRALGLEGIGRTFEHFSQSTWCGAGHGSHLAREVRVIGKAEFGRERRQISRWLRGEASQRGLRADDPRET